MRNVLELTIPATQHICFDNSREGWDFAMELQKEICRTVHSAIEETPERKPYLDSIGDGHDLDEGELKLLPKSVQEATRDSIPNKINSCRCVGTNGVRQKR